MSREDDHEPPFVRSDWGTNRYVYNHRSPIGRSFIVISLAIAAGGLVLRGPLRPLTPVPVRADGTEVAERLTP
ncbi:hypothetical protein L7D48_14340 [Streptomyces sp. S1A]|uniref:hypothetical protein n=1 Tax=Streptomyces sp. ICN903 TaxID=2964654 RepID=UPI001EDC6300|nr:hypothetical protein [Streptomyces sp. ICN903]MCG3041727.1 hypothetical protein [Streptomyces sp. ICN903]